MPSRALLCHKERLVSSFSLNMPLLHVCQETLEPLTPFGTASFLRVSSKLQVQLLNSENLLNVHIPTSWDKLPSFYRFDPYNVVHEFDRVCCIHDPSDNDPNNLCEFSFLLMVCQSPLELFLSSASFFRSKKNLLAVDYLLGWFVFVHLV